MLKSLRAKLILLSLVPAIVPLILVFLLIRHQQADAVQAAADECRRINVVSLDEIAHGLYTACETQHEVLQSMVDSGLRLTNDVIGRLGGASLDAAEAVSWTAVNQYTQETRAVSLPKLLVGSTWLGQNSDTQIPSPVVDEVRDIVGGTATVFQRMNREGDMLRVCTNVAGTDGTRAIGTFVPATNPDGTPNPVVAAVLAGQTFHGRAYVVDRWYITAYEPIFDANREVIGVSYFGVPMESTQALRQAVMDVQIAETGYVYVLDTQGHYVISKDGKRDGENIWDAKDSDGVHFIQEIVAKARAGEEHEIFSQYYPWKNEGEAPRMKVARCIYYEPWDWIIGASSYIDEFEAAPRQIKADGHRNLLVLLVVMIATSFVATLLGVVASRRIVAPVLRAVGVADRIAQGDLSEKLDLQGEDEVARLGGALDRMVDGLRSKAGMAEVIANGDLTVEPEVISERDLFGRALRQMTDSLNEILRGVMETANTVATGSREIRSASADSARSATEQAASLEEMSSATTELSQQVELNAVSARRADEVSRNALSAAEVGAERMGALNVAMAEISTSSQQMAQIIEAIDEIAEQTNLLALNAAIEAARAGEHGRSFAVVADEVRNLAARSASAAQETTGLIRGSLDRIARGIDIAEETSTALRTISDGVREASGLVAQIAAASQEQAAAITEVSANLIQIDQMTGRSSAATEEAASSAGELSKQAETLERLLGRFRLRA